MITKPDCWLSETYDRSFGPRGQWGALRRLYTGMPLVGEDFEWLLNTTVDEVDGKMVDILEEWLKENLIQEPEGDTALPEIPPQMREENRKQPVPEAVMELQPQPSSAETANAIAPRSTANVIGDLFADIGNEIEDIKKGLLTIDKASEIAKFRTMQIRSMELVLQAGHLEVKVRQQRNGR